MELEEREKVFNEFYERSGKKLKWFCYKQIGGHQDIDDMMQIALFHIYNNIHQYDSKRNKIESWAFAVAKNKCIDYLRRNKKEKLIYFDGLPINKFRYIENCLARKKKDDEIAKNKIEKLNEAVSKLKESDSRLIELFYFNHIGFKEIGSSLNISSNNVAAKFVQIRKKIRKNLGC